jgi:hypothetical protein
MTTDEYTPLERFAGLLRALNQEGTIRFATEHRIVNSDDCLRVQPIEIQEELLAMERRFDRDVCKPGRVLDEKKLGVIAELSGLDISVAGSPYDAEAFAVQVSIADGLIEFPVHLE